MRLRQYLHPLAIASTALAFCTGAAFAQSTLFGSPVPRDSAAPEPMSLYKMFAGKSADWGAGSYAYFAPDGTFRAVNEAEQSLGMGRWYVTTNSKMCYDAAWMWRQDFNAQSSEVLTCARFRVDSNGELWSTTGSMAGPWFPFSAANMRRGDMVSGRFSTLYSSFGIAPRSTKNN